MILLLSLLLILVVLIHSLLFAQSFSYSVLFWMAALNEWTAPAKVSTVSFMNNTTASTSCFRMTGNYTFKNTDGTKRIVNSAVSGSSGSSKIKPTWTCRECGKALSSKRSFDEHSNIHSQSKPFACEHCDFAAASQMTLRRHNLRFHTPRQSWGYKCPYCSELYMEPASYQQHVASRHFGRSATFGCPSTGCSFTTRCSGHFISHVSKHSRMNVSFSRIANTPLERFIVDDKLGVGYGKRPLKKIVRPEFIRKVLSTEIALKDYMKTPLNCPKSRSDVTSSTSSTLSISTSFLSTKKDVVGLKDAEADNTVEIGLCNRDPYNAFQFSDNVVVDGVDFIAEDVDCLEVVVDDTQSSSNVLHEGMVEPELD